MSIVNHLVRIVAGAALFFGCSGLMAQDIRKDIAADLVHIRQAYGNLGAVSMDIHYNFYPTYTATEPLETHTGYYCKQGKDNSRMELYGTLTLSNKDLVMVKDDSSMLFMVKKHSPQDVSALTHEQFEKLLAVCSSVEKAAGSNAGSSGYRLRFDGSTNGMCKMEFFFDKVSYLVTRIVMYYNYPPVKNYRPDQVQQHEKPRMEVEYRNVNTKPALDSKVFSTGRYLKKGKDKWQLTSAYASAYELFDQTQTLK